MLPATRSLPKLLLEVAGRPFADWQLSWLAEQGVENVVLCVGHLADTIESYVGDGRRWGVDVTYVREGDTLMGTAGALRLALEEGQLDRAFLVLYGDSLLDIDVSAVWGAFERAGCPALMTIFRNEGRWDVSNSAVEGNLVTRYEKGLPDAEAQGLAYIDYGLLVLCREVVSEEVPSGEPADLAVVQARLSARRRLAAFVASERFFEIGSPAGRRELEAFLAGRTPPPLRQ
jgi:NDP-sugar pyrophosphorylase family protein